MVNNMVIISTEALAGVARESTAAARLDSCCEPVEPGTKTALVRLSMSYPPVGDLNSQ